MAGARAKGKRAGLCTMSEVAARGRWATRPGQRQLEEATVCAPRKIPAKTMNSYYSFHGVNSVDCWREAAHQRQPAAAAAAAAVAAAAAAAAAATVTATAATAATAASIGASTHPSCH